MRSQGHSTPWKPPVGKDAALPKEHVQIFRAHFLSDTIVKHYTFLSLCVILQFLPGGMHLTKWFSTHESLCHSKLSDSYAVLCSLMFYPVSRLRKAPRRGDTDIF